MGRNEGSLAILGWRKSGEDSPQSALCAEAEARLGHASSPLTLVVSLLSWASVCSGGAHWVTCGPS